MKLCTGKECGCDKGWSEEKEDGGARFSTGGKERRKDREKRLFPHFGFGLVSALVRESEKKFLDFFGAGEAGGCLFKKSLKWRVTET